MPGVARHIEHDPWQDGHGRFFKRRPSLPFVDEEHFILGQVAMDRNRSTRSQALGPHGKGRSAALGINLDDNLARGGRAELEDFVHRCGYSTPRDTRSLLFYR